MSINILIQKKIILVNFGLCTLNGVFFIFAEHIKKVENRSYCGHLEPSHPNLPNAFQRTLVLFTSMQHTFCASDFRNRVLFSEASLAAKTSAHLHFRYCSGVNRRVAAIVTSPACNFSK